MLNASKHQVSAPRLHRVEVDRCVYRCQAVTEIKLPVKTDKTLPPFGFTLFPAPPPALAIVVGTPYASSKAAMNQLTRNWGCEWAPDGIRVNAVAPWYTKTPLTEPAQADTEK